MSGSGEHLKALVRSHAQGDDASFYSVALQAAAAAARRGHNQVAADLKKIIDSAQESSPLRTTRAVPIAQPRGELAELVVASYPDVSLQDFIGPPDLLDQLRQVILEQRQRRRLLEHGYTPAHRLLLDGPPGTGKTMTAAVLASELSLPLLTVRLESVLSRYLGETASKLRVLFDSAADHRAVFLFDEFDALGADRGGNDVGEARRILNAFLVFLEGASPESIVVAATNHRSLLDHALFRRFDVVLTYSLPTTDHAWMIMHRRLGRLGADIDWDTLAQDAQGLSHADLVAACEAAAKKLLLTSGTVVSTSDLQLALSARHRVGLA
ncbi:AAA family ATPase [Kineococcus sp. SYSU DK003]|uniref:AAA family ATPase n=1 Tax=Kineococcus sp. SYSU DK003 TaxID=3383124 RepID=UPI003D7CB709